MDTIRRLEWKSVFDTVHGYMFRYHKSGDDRIRPSAGSDNASLKAENSRAVVNAVYGSTVKWNQLLNSYTTYASVRGFYAKVSDGTVTLTANSSLNSSSRIEYGTSALGGVSAHKYLVKMVVKSSVGATVGIHLAGTPSLVELAVNTKTTVSRIITPANTNTEFGLYPNITSGMSENDTFTLYSLMVTDLTAIGIDNLTTVAEVESWLALNVGAQDYYPYDAGSLISFGGTGIKSVGFNQWDEQWDIGNFDVNGAKISGTKLRSKNFISCFPNTVYRKSGTNRYGWINMFYYDINKRFISQDSPNWTGDGTFTTPLNCYYFKFVSYTSFNTYYHDICINLSDPAKNGTYEPYWSDTCDLSFAQNIPDPSDPTKKLFPYGLCSAGSVHDEVSATTAIKRIGSVDLGTLTGWSVSGANRVAVTFSDGVGVGGYNEVSNIICSRYTTTSKQGVDNASGTIAYRGNRIYINDSTLSIVNGKITKLNGVLLYFELATPIVVNLSPEQQMVYKVDKYSTEEIIFPTSQTGAPTSTALDADIDYQYRG